MRLGPGTLIGARDDLDRPFRDDLGARDAGINQGEDRVFGDGTRTGGCDEAKGGRSGKHLVVEVDLIGRPDRDAGIGHHLAPAKGTAAFNRGLARPVDDRQDSGLDGVVGDRATACEGHADRAGDRHRHGGGVGLDRGLVEGLDAHETQSIDGGAIDLRTHRACDQVVGNRYADGDRAAKGAERRSNRHRHHR